MPWKECNRMEERLRFVARLLDGEKMAVVWQFLPINKNRTCDHLIKSQYGRSWRVFEVVCNCFKPIDFIS